MIRIGLIVTALFFCTPHQETAAQRLGRVPHYFRGNTVSPYVNLLGRNVGGINNYFSLVRPMQTQQRINQMQWMENQRLAAQFGGYPLPGQMGFSRLPQRTLRVPGAEFPTGAAPTLRAGPQGMGLPHQAATFLNTSHFYPTPRTPRR